MAEYTCFIFIFIILISTSSASHLNRLLEIHERERAPPAVQEAAARRVLSRLLPSHLSSFDFKIIPKESCGGNSCFIINNHPSVGRKGAPRILFIVKSNPKWCCTYLLDATDPLFLEIGKAFIEKQLEEYGRTSHVYNWYDLIDLTRQALPKYANQVFMMVIEAYQHNDVEKASIYSNQFLGLVSDLDKLWSCHDGFLLGLRLESAKNLAKDSEQEKQYEWNARTQITMWFDNTETEASLLRDYGNKYWSGLLADYYKPRAAIYFKYLLESMMKGVEFGLEEGVDWSY